MKLLYFLCLSGFLWVVVLASYGPQSTTVDDVLLCMESAAATSSNANSEPSPTRCFVDSVAFQSVLRLPSVSYQPRTHRSHLTDIIRNGFQRVKRALQWVEEHTTPFSSLRSRKTGSSDTINDDTKVSGSNLRTGTAIGSGDQSLTTKPAQTSDQEVPGSTTAVPTQSGAGPTPTASTPPQASPQSGSNSVTSVAASAESQPSGGSGVPSSAAPLSEPLPSNSASPSEPAQSPVPQSSGGSNPQSLSAPLSESAESNDASVSEPVPSPTVPVLPSDNTALIPTLTQNRFGESAVAALNGVNNAVPGGAPGIVASGVVNGMSNVSAVMPNMQFTTSELANGNPTSGAAPSQPTPFAPGDTSNSSSPMISPQAGAAQAQNTSFGQSDISISSASMVSGAGGGQAGAPPFANSSAPTGSSPNVAQFESAVQVAEATISAAIAAVVAEASSAGVDLPVTGLGPVNTMAAGTLQTTAFANTAPYPTVVASGFAGQLGAAVGSGVPGMAAEQTPLWQNTTAAPTISGNNGELQGSGTSPYFNTPPLAGPMTTPWVMNATTPPGPSTAYYAVSGYQTGTESTANLAALVGGTNGTVEPTSGMNSGPVVAPNSGANPPYANQTDPGADGGDTSTSSAATAPYVNQTNASGDVGDTSTNLTATAPYANQTNTDADGGYNSTNSTVNTLYANQTETGADNGQASTNPAMSPPYGNATSPNSIVETMSPDAGSSQYSNATTVADSGGEGLSVFPISTVYTTEAVSTIYATATMPNTDSGASLAIDSNFSPPAVRKRDKRMSYPLVAPVMNPTLVSKNMRLILSRGASDSTPIASVITPSPSPTNILEELYDITTMSSLRSTVSDGSFNIDTFFRAIRMNAADVMVMETSSDPTLRGIVSTGVGGNTDGQTTAMATPSFARGSPVKEIADGQLQAPLPCSMSTTTPVTVSPSPGSTPSGSSPDPTPTMIAVSSRALSSVPRPISIVSSAPKTTAMGSESSSSVTPPVSVVSLAPTSAASSSVLSSSDSPSMSIISSATTTVISSEPSNSDSSLTLIMSSSPTTITISSTSASLVPAALVSAIISAALGATPTYTSTQTTNTDPIVSTSVSPPQMSSPPPTTLSTVASPSSPLPSPEGPSTSTDPPPPSPAPSPPASSTSVPVPTPCKNQGPAVAFCGEDGSVGCFHDVDPCKIDLK